MLPNIDILTTDFKINDISSRTYKLNLEEDKINNYIDEIEAIKQTIYLILNTERYDNIIYSWNYGVELKDLIGEPVTFVCAELQRRIIDALIQDDRINNVDEFNFELTSRNTITSKFTVHTIFGDIKTEKVVNI